MPPRRVDHRGLAGVAVTLVDERAPDDGSADEGVPAEDPYDDLERWARFVAEVLHAEELTTAVKTVAEKTDAGLEVSVRFVDEADMAALNVEWMHQAGPTDVLSFPLDREPPADGSPWLLGDLVVCPDVAIRQAPSHAGSADDELALLLVHGVLHLLGHDHAEPDERDAMQGRERMLLATCHGELAGDPWSELPTVAGDERASA